MLLLILCTSPGASFSRTDVWQWGCWVTGYAHLHFSCVLNCCSSVRLFATLWTVACQAPLSVGFSRQECCRGLRRPFLWDLPDPEIEPASPASKTLKADSLSIGLPPQFSSVQFRRSVVSDSLRPHESQHTRPPCPSPTPGVHSDSRPSSQWCHPAISSSVVPFSSCPQSLPASESLGSTKLLSKILVSFVLSKYFWYPISLQALDFSKGLISCQTGGSK